MACFMISNMNTSQEFLRDTLIRGEGGHLNWDMATNRWQTYSHRLAQTKQTQGFVVTEFVDLKAMRAACRQDKKE